MTTRAALLAPLATALTLSTAAGQEPPPQPPAPRHVDWAPRWRIGDWWVVQTYQRDVTESTTTPNPAEGGAPYIPDDVELPGTPLPDLPPMRDGVPVGYKVGNRFRFEVVREEAVTYEDDGPEDAPERFWVVRVRTLDGEHVRRAELWFAQVDLSLAKVVLAPDSERPRERWLRGTALLDIPISRDFGFPFDWPDLAAVARPEAIIPTPGRPDVEQRMRTVGPPDAIEVQILLLEAPPAPDEGGDREEGAGDDDPDQRRRGGARVRFDWRPGDLFWSRHVSSLFVGVLVERSR